MGLAWATESVIASGEKNARLPLYLCILPVSVRLILICLMQ
jgi:hypothetical protein